MEKNDEILFIWRKNLIVYICNVITLLLVRKVRVWPGRDQARGDAGGAHLLGHPLPPGQGGAHPPAQSRGQVPTPTNQPELPILIQPFYFVQYLGRCEKQSVVFVFKTWRLHFVSWNIIYFSKLLFVMFCEISLHLAKFCLVSWHFSQKSWHTIFKLKNGPTW